MVGPVKPGERNDAQLNGGSRDRGCDSVYGVARVEERRRDLAMGHKGRAGRTVFADPPRGLPRVGLSLPTGHHLALRLLRPLLVRPLLVTFTAERAALSGALG